MPRAVKFRHYGGPEVLEVMEVETPVAGEGAVVVEVVTAALNPGEVAIREGAFAAFWPAHFPEGQGNDFAGRVSAVGPGVTDFGVGDHVIGFAPRAAQADFVVVSTDALIHKPRHLDWEAAATIPGVGATAWASVEAISPQSGDTIVVSAAAGGVGSLAAQLARTRGARVIGTASQKNFALLRSLQIEPVEYGPGLADRLRQASPSGIDGFLDNFGDGNVEMAISLGVSPSRINTIADGQAIARWGVRSAAQEQANTTRIWQQIAQLAADGVIVVPIDSVYSIEEIQDAYRDVASRHGGGKRVLRLRESPSE